MSVDENQIMQAIHGAAARPALEKVAKKVTGGCPVISSDEWLAALRALDGVALEFTQVDAIRDSYLWFDGEAFRAANLPPGLEDREERPLGRIQAAALLDRAVPLVDPVPLSEVDT